MSDKARRLLQRMASEYDSTKNPSFDCTFYLGYSDSVLSELEYYGYIIRKNDILDSIELTDAGYEEAKK